MTGDSKRSSKVSILDVPDGEKRDQHPRVLLVLLLLAYIMNFVDRQILNILAEPIKLEMGLSDAQLGMLTGLSFAIFYTAFGIPLGRIADRVNRVSLISASMFIWSGFTIACGMATNFIQLTLFRIGVGIGEAGCSPAAHSLIADYVPENRRSGALAVYSIGVPIGSLLGLTLGGVLAHALGWRWAIIAVGIPGIILSMILMLVLRDPRHAKTAHHKDRQISFTEVLLDLKRKPSFWWLACGAAFTAFVAYGQSSFLASFYLREHGDGLQTATIKAAEMGLNIGETGVLGTSLGLIVGITGILGILAGGWLGDRGSQMDIRAYTKIPAYAALLAIPTYLLCLVVEGFTLSLLLLILPMFLKPVWHGPVYAAIQSLSHPGSRGTSVAILLFVINIIGLGLGPLAVGALSDVLHHSGLDDGAALRYSMMSCGLLGFLASAACFFRAGKSIQANLTNAKSAVT